MDGFVLKDHLWATERHVRAIESVVAVYIVQEGSSPPTPRQLDVLASLEDICAEAKQALAACAIRYYQDVSSRVDLSAEGVLVDTNRIEQHFRYVSILIPELRDCEVDYLFLSADCDWEQEHGMQFLLEGGRVLYCGDHTSLPFSPLWINILSAAPDEREILAKRYCA